MAPLTLYGAAAVTAMLLFYAFEARARVFVLAFAVACLASSAYGFLQGAWPFGVVELVWSGIALRRWQVRRTSGGRGERSQPDTIRVKVPSGMNPQERQVSA